MLLWVDKSESKDGKVSAVVPRGVNDVQLRENTKFIAVDQAVVSRKILSIHFASVVFLMPY